MHRHPSWNFLWNRVKWLVLLAIAFIVLVVILSGYLMYRFERSYQPDKATSEIQNRLDSLKVIAVQGLPDSEKKRFEIELLRLENSIDKIRKKKEDEKISHFGDAILVTFAAMGIGYVQKAPSTLYGKLLVVLDGLAGVLLISLLIAIFIKGAWFLFKR